MFLVLSVKNRVALDVIIHAMDAANNGNFQVNDDQRVVLQPIESTDDSFTDGWIESTETVRAVLRKITGQQGEFVAQYVQDDLLAEVRYLSSLSYTSIGTGTDVAFVHNTDDEIIFIGDGCRNAIYTLIGDVLGQGAHTLDLDKAEVLYYESEFSEYLKWHESKVALPISVVETKDWMQRKELQYAIHNAMAISALSKLHITGSGYIDVPCDGYYVNSGIDKSGLTAEDIKEIEAAKAEIDALEAKCKAIINKHARW